MEKLGIEGIECFELVDTNVGETKGSLTILQVMRESPQGRGGGGLSSHIRGRRERRQLRGRRRSLTRLGFGRGVQGRRLPVEGLQEGAEQPLLLGWPLEGRGALGGWEAEGGR